MKVRVFPAVGTLPEGVKGQWQPVIIDVLRATSVIVTALAAGARAVEPCTTPGEVDVAWGRRGSETPPPLKAGERGGLRIPGYDLGNSPLEYRTDCVLGRTLCFTTSNGTLALQEAARHGEVVCAALLNRRAVAEVLAAREGDVMILCAGTARAFSADDLAAAGAVIEALRPLAPGVETDDLGAVAEQWFLAHRANLPLMLSRTGHGRHLVDLGFARDLDCCGALDRHGIVPVLRDGLIVPLETGMATP